MTMPSTFLTLAIATTALLLVGIDNIPQAEALSTLPSSRSVNEAGGLSRRDVFIGATGAALGFGVVGSPSAWADNGNSAPIAVVGASGRTGALCVASCLRRGLPVKALTRSGVWPPSKVDLNAVGYTGDATSSNPLLTIEACDVKDAASLSSKLANCRAVIYAASASKSGGNSKAIDGDGVIDTANACLANNVGRYIVLSSGATTRPTSLGFKFTEMAVAGIMTNKRLGEVGVANAYSNNNKKCSYTIVRPGGLDEPKQNIIQGPSALEISQGDVLSGFVSRADVAEVAVELALSNASNVQNTALELYYKNKVVPVDRKYKRYVDPENNSDVKRLVGDTYQELFSGVVPNYDYLVVE